jgi:hypothetical protein
MQFGDILGAWGLQSFEIEDGSGVTRPWGENMRGLLIYEASGAMSVSIIRDAPDPKPSDWEPMDDVLFYAGKASISGRKVEHRVEIATERERIGQALVRDAELTGDTLQISNRTACGGTARLIWRRRA